MSSRQLRKLQQQRELEQAKLQTQVEEENNEESEDEPIAPAKFKPSLFANLAGLEDPRGDDDESEEEEVNHVQKELSDQFTPPSTAKKSKKKKKKNKKAKDKAKESLAGPSIDDDEIEKALRELELQKPSGGVSTAWTSMNLDPEYERICSLLGTNTQHLKVANEMRNLFGKAAVETRDDAGGPAGRGGRRRQRAQQQQVDLETALKGHHAPGKGLSPITLRRNALIEGKDDWPRGTTGGLTMEVVDEQAEDGTVEFRYVHDVQYQILQQTFHGYVEMGDPQNLIGLLTRHPYHISLLIQVSKIAKDQSDHSLSADLLERALFTFGRAAPSLFNNKFAQGKARLDFSRPENRELWLAGYQYIKMLVMKGTYRTALEWAKFLLSLDPEEDPYCMRLMVHQLAIRAHEFQWLLDFYGSKISDNWSSGKDDTHTTPSLAYAAMQLRDGKQSRKLLSDSMQRLPWLFTTLFKELNLEAPPSIWGITPQTDAEKLFTELYVRQTKDLWNTPEATALLMEIAHTSPKVELDLLPTIPNSEMTLDVVRFVYLDNTPTLMALVPSNLLHRSNNSDADPLPPFVNIYSYDSQQRQIEGRERGLGGAGDDFFDPLAALARLLPGFRLGHNRDRDDDGVDLGSDIDSEMDYDDAIRRGLEDVVAEGEADGVDETAEGQQGAVPVSVARRLLNMFWQTNSSGGAGEVEDEEGDTDTDTDDDMPELIDYERR